MTSPLHKKLRTTLRRTFSKIASVADNGLSVLTALAASGLVLTSLTAPAFADGWQGRHAYSTPVVAPTASAPQAATVKQNASKEKVHLVAYTANSDNLQWATPAQPQNIGVKTIRQTVRRTASSAPSPSVNTVAQTSSPYSDPFGDRTPRTPDGNPPVELESVPGFDSDLPDVGLPDGATMPELESVPTAPAATPDAALDSDVPITQDFEDAAPVPPTVEDAAPAAPVLEDVGPSAPNFDSAPATPTKPATPAVPRRSIDNSNFSPALPTVKQRDIEAPFISAGEDPRNRMRENCPPVSSLKPISQITNDIAAPEGEFPNECTLGDEPFAGRAFQPICYSWAAPGLAINPLYFEEPALERYGHSACPIFQPIISAGHFVLTVPALPWLMAIDPPNECQYVLGYYRPGECAPYVLDPIPFSVRAALVEGGVATALVFLIP